MFDGALFKSLIAMIVLLAWQACAGAAEFDPTRPPTLSSKPMGPAPAIAKVNPQDYKVTSILIADQRKVAVINNQVVTAGDSVKAAGNGKVTVKEITASTVRLFKAHQEFEVRLASEDIGKISLIGNDEGQKESH